VRDRRDDEPGLPDRRQADEGDAAGKVQDEPLRHPDRQPRLAHPAGTGEGQQPHLGLAQQILQLGDLALPPHQRGQRKRQRCGREGRGAPLGCPRLE
jgi:hypothetical protein